jgi:hypothetical protein
MSIMFWVEIVAQGCAKINDGTAIPSYEIVVPLYVLQLYLKGNWRLLVVHAGSLSVYVLEAFDSLSSGKVEVP